MLSSFLVFLYFLCLILFQTSIYASIANPPGPTLLPKQFILPSFAGLIMVGPHSKSSIDLKKNHFGVKPSGDAVVFFFCSSLAGVVHIVVQEGAIFTVATTYTKCMCSTVRCTW